MRNSFALILIFSISTTSFADQPIRFVSNVDVAPDGSQITFDWNGDIWLAPVQGGTAKPLTRNPARDRSPRFSPDGKSLAFISDREGSKFSEVIAPGHESYSPNIRACLGLLLWLDDPAFRGNDFEVVINDFSDIVNVAKNGSYQIELPLPPAKLLADFIY